MKHLFVIAVLFYALSLIAENQKAVVTAGVLNVRVKPSAKSDTLIQLRRGDEVVVIAKGDEWTAIRPPERSSLYVSSPLIADGKLKSNGNLRSGSGVNFQSLCILPAGTPVTVVEDKNQWSRIAVPDVDVRCYVASRYLKFVETPAKNTETKEVIPPVAPVVNKNDIISFGKEKIDAMKKNSIVKGTEKNVEVTGILTETSAKNSQVRTFGLNMENQFYHVAGVIPAAVDIAKPVKISGVSLNIRNWKNPMIIIQKIVQK